MLSPISILQSWLDMALQTMLITLMPFYGIVWDMKVDGFEHQTGYDLD